MKKSIQWTRIKTNNDVITIIMWNYLLFFTLEATY